MSRGVPASGRVERSVQRSVMALVVTAVVAFALVATGSVYEARRIARDDVLSEATRSAHTVADAVFLPVLPAVMKRDPLAVGFLDRAVRIRSRDGSLVRVKVWSSDGTVIYSDDHALVGRTFGVSPKMQTAIVNERSTVELSTLDDPENTDEAAQFDRLVEVYLPLTLEDGTHLVFEMYSTDARLLASESRLISQLVPFALSALLILVLTQLPVAVWLVRRVGRAQRERARLLANSFAASERERRNIAGDLHDGVVQDLAGVGFALGAVARSMPPETAARTRDMLEKSCAAVQRSVHDLRTLIIDVHPPDLAADGLQTALQELGERLRAGGAVDRIDVRVEPPALLDPQVVALLYRCTRECLANVAKHAAASHVSVHLSGDEEHVRLQVSDDGRGLPPSGFDRRAEGHVGLVLLADAARDLRGHLSVTCGATGGTTVILVLPAHERGAHRPAAILPADAQPEPAAVPRDPADCAV